VAHLERWAKKWQNAFLMRVHSILLAGLVAGALCDSYAALEFSAYLTAHDQVQVLLTDLDTGSRSRWLTIGDSFRGHVLVTFEKDQEAITLDQAGRSIVLRLKDSRVIGSEEVSTRAEIKVMISDDGAFILDGKTLNQLALIEHFEELSRTGKQIALTIRAPAKSTNQNAESTRKILNSFAVSGAKGSVSILTADGQLRVIRPKPTN
jgi:hypothetical protein